MITEVKNIQIWQEDGSFMAGSLFVQDGRFVAPATPDEVVDGEGMLAVPGLIDVHTHGRAGADFCTATEEELLHVAKDFVRHGVTAVTPALASDTFEGWQKTAARIAACPDPTYVGLHLEGNYLSPKRRGAHAPQLLVAPNATEVLEIAATVAPKPLRVTFAPELDEDGSFAATLREAGIAMSMGHTDADHKTAMQAISRGVSSATHLFNTMPPLHHRAGGTIVAALNEDIYAELIVDGFHVAPEVVKLAYRAKGVDRLVLISDSMQGTGCPDGEYSIAGQPVYLKNGEAYTADGAIAGSTLSLLDGVRNLAAFAGIPFGRALICATKTPAALLGLQGKLGSLAVGARADLLLLAGEGKKGELPVRVMQNGAFVGI